jgi:predicted MFS family arabinose efflux permease
VRVEGTVVGTRRVAFAASACLAAAIVPVFLTGTLARPMGAELGYGEAATGVAITLFFVAAGLGATPMGRVTARIGAGPALRLGVALSSLAGLAVATVASRWWHVAAAMVVGGVAVGLVDTAGARAFAEAVRARRRGLVFGIKEASVPLASMVAGAAVPLLAARLGWRATFAAVVLLAAAALVAVPRHLGAEVPDGGVGSSPTPAGVTPPPAARDGASPGATAGGAATARPPGRAEDRGAHPRPLVALVVGVAAASAAANGAATLFVPTATAGGMTEATAGALLAGASVASVVARVGLGWSTDRGGVRALDATIGAMVLGAAGTVLLALTATGPVAVVGAVLALGGGWGWTGLAFLAAVERRPDAPAQAAATVLLGLAVGGALGPTLFGVAVSRGGAAVAWYAAAAAFLAGAIAVAISRRGERVRSAG